MTGVPYRTQLQHHNKNSPEFNRQIKHRTLKVRAEKPPKKPISREQLTPQTLLVRSASRKRLWGDFSKNSGDPRRVRFRTRVLARGQLTREWSRRAGCDIYGFYFYFCFH